MHTYSKIGARRKTENIFNSSYNEREKNKVGMRDKAKHHQRQIEKLFSFFTFTFVPQRQTMRIIMINEIDLVEKVNFTEKEETHTEQFRDTTKFEVVKIVSKFNKFKKGNIPKKREKLLLK